MVEWSFAVKLSVVGFLTVFGVLGVVALALWLTGLVSRKVGGENDGRSGQ